MHSTFVYSLKLSVLRGAGGKALATDQRAAVGFEYGAKLAQSCQLRTFARKSSNIDNFTKLLLPTANELLVSETQKIDGGHRLRFDDMISESARLF